MKNLTLIATCILLVSCSSVLIKHDYGASTAISENQYSNNATTKGVVLLAVNWSRSWNCGGYENSELRSVGFDHLPVRYDKDDQPPDFVVNGSAGRPGFMNFAFVLEPGEYAISYIKVKVAKSVSDVGFFTAKRSKLIENNNPKGGTFKVGAGEVVYIGHFGLDCAKQPIIWRYYAENKESFDKYVDSYKFHYPYLDLSNVQYRLFQTKEFGHDFELK